MGQLSVEASEQVGIQERYCAELGGTGVVDTTAGDWSGRSGINYIDGNINFGLMVTEKGDERVQCCDCGGVLAIDTTMQSVRTSTFQQKRKEHALLRLLKVNDHEFTKVRDLIRIQYAGQGCPQL